ncbi:MAG: 50S ribosomal protein L30e [Candidatus Micrarchaeaceae archaeon]
MADLNIDVRLAVDSGETAIGAKSTIKSIIEGKAKLIVTTSKSKKELLDDLNHLSKIAGIKIVVFDGTPIEFGAVCGKPYSVSVISIINPGDSGILKNFSGE